MKAIIGLLILAGIIYLLTRMKKKPADQKPVPVKNQTADQKKNTENLKVAGISFYNDAVMSFAEENPDYKLTKKQIIGKGLQNVSIDKYVFLDLPAEFVFEPENEHDPNAIAIYVEGKQIGYVKKGSTAHIRNLINADAIQSAICHFGGGAYKLYDSDTEVMEEEDSDFRAKITLNLK